MRITFDKYDALVPVTELKNSRFQTNKHPDDQIEALAKNMRELGVQQPIHVSKKTGEIVFGHGRRDAAIINGWTEYPVVYHDFKDETEEFISVQADNAYSHRSELDLGQINLMIQEVGPFDTELLGIKDFMVEPQDKPNKNSSEKSEVKACPSCGYEF
jgi:ParB-like chromosome segregation protein Spo0J